MANALTANPIIIDTVGATSEITEKLRLESIVIVPSAANWVVLLHKESAGTNIVLSAVGSTADSDQYFLPEDLVFTLYATTLTNITRLLLFRR